MSLYSISNSEVLHMRESYCSYRVSSTIIATGVALHEAIKTIRYICMSQDIPTMYSLI